MVKSRKIPNSSAHKDSTFIVILGVLLTNVLLSAALLSKTWSFLVGWIVAFSIGYWIPPRPPEGFLSWILERSIIMLGACLAVFRVPELLSPMMPGPLAYGIPIMVFFGALIAWLRHRRRSFSSEE